MFRVLAGTLNDWESYHICCVCVCVCVAQPVPQEGEKFEEHGPIDEPKTVEDVKQVSIYIYIYMRERENDSPKC